MRRILVVFRKDVRHLWPQIAAVSALMALAAVFDPTYRGWQAPYFDLLPSLMLPLACWLLAISAIHQEALIGDRQYWLTRPYSWRELLAAKFLFLAAFLNLPLLLYHAGVYAAVGVPLADHFGALLWRQVFFTAFYVLPAAGLGAITRNLGRALVVILLGGVGFLVATAAHLFIVRRPLPFGQETDAGAVVARAAVLAAGVSALLLLQYAWRKTGASRVVVGAGAAALLLMPVSNHAARPAVAALQARLSVDPDPSRHSRMATAGDPAVETFDVPVRLAGIPQGAALDHTYVNLSIHAPDKSALRYVVGELHGLAGGRGWLYFSIDRRWLRTEGQPLALSGELELHLFGNPSAFPLPVGHTVKVPAVGACRDFSGREGSLSFRCYSPWPRAAVMAGSPGERVNWIVSPTSVESSIPTAAGFLPLRRFTSVLPYQSREQTAGLKLVAAVPQAPLRVTFRLLPVRLQDYAVRDRSDSGTAALRVPARSHQ